LSDESFLCNAKPKAARQAAVCNTSSRTRSNLPIPGSCLVRREGQAREFQIAPAATNGKEHERRSERTRCAFFVEIEFSKLPLAQVGADIEPRNSPLDFDFESRLINSSMASTVESGLKTLRRTQTRLSSSAGSSSSSLRVPER